MKLFAPFQLDFYKTGHHEQYPKGTEYIYSNLTARSPKHANFEDSDGVIFIGIQLFIKDYLIREWNEHFFSQDKDTVIGKYKLRMEMSLGKPFDTTHLEKLHDLGYLPILIKALPEGSLVPYKVPMLTVVNTHPEFSWVTNMIESVLSAELWQMINTATTCRQYLKNFYRYAAYTGADMDFVPFQAHDFSFRGMAGREAAAKSGFAHIATGAYGTDSVSAIDIAIDYYNAEPRSFIAGSVSATEHSVMCAGTKEGELETYRRLLTEVYPTGIVSIVSDTWDLYNVLDNILPALKDVILARDGGQVVIRPDSGDPVDILCGTEDRIGVIESLANTFGYTINKLGYKVLNPKVGAIYGDSITIERQITILHRLMDMGFCSSNVVLGIGSYTYQYNTRDTHGIAMKATSATINGERIDIYKDPITDDGLKKSARGLMMVSLFNGKFEMRDQVTEREEKHGCLREVFRDGKLLINEHLSTIRFRIDSTI